MQKKLLQCQVLCVQVSSALEQGNVFYVMRVVYGKSIMVALAGHTHNETISSVFSFLCRDSLAVGDHSNDHRERQ